MTETAGQAPQHPPYPYGAYPPPPPRKPRRKTGLIVGGVIGGVVLLIALVAVVVIVGRSGGGGNGASPGDDFEIKYRLSADPCESIKTDVEDVGIDGSMNGSSDESGEGTGTAACTAKLQKRPGDHAYYVLFSAELSVNSESMGSRYDNFVDQYLEGCETSDFSGAWEKGTVGWCTSDSTGVVIQDANVDIMFAISGYGGLGLNDIQPYLTSLLEKMLDKLRA